MIELPDPKNKIPEQVKADAWAFHVLARSDDPAIKCLNIKNLVSTLQSSVELAGVSNTPIYDEEFKLNTTLGDYLVYQSRGANTAWNKYTQGQSGYGVEIANTVLKRVLFLVYDTRYTKAQSNSFVPRSE